ncbi:MAG TPA: hypothetical protein ENJ95_05285 [Bacteroidetes bacterium]|nr:hypothetical protein [Bacteroidota bacterium]
MTLWKNELFCLAIIKKNSPGNGKLPGENAGIARQFSIAGQFVQECQSRTKLSFYFLFNFLHYLFGFIFNLGIIPQNEFPVHFDFPNIILRHFRLVVVF